MTTVREAPPPADDLVRRLDALARGRSEKSGLPIEDYVEWQAVARIEALQAEVARLERERDEAAQDAARVRIEMGAATIAAEARAEAAEKDAERYRWLRGSGAAIDRHRVPGKLFHYGIGLDAAIDAARAKGET